MNADESVFQREARSELKRSMTHRERSPDQILCSESGPKSATDEPTIDKRPCLAVQKNFKKVKKKLVTP